MGSGTKCMKLKQMIAYDYFLRKGFDIVESFDQTWESIHQEQEWGKYPSEEVIRFVARNYYTKDRKSIRILDAGCGTGAIAWFLAREGFSVYGFDGSKTAIEKGKQRMQNEGLTVELSVCDAACLPYPDNFFDAVIDSVMLCANTVDGIQAILGECHRTLKPGGRFLSTGLFRAQTTGHGTGRLIEPETYTEITSGCLAGRGTVHFFSYPEIIRLWEKAGFKNLLIDWLDRTQYGGRECVSFYLVEAER